MKNSSGTIYTTIKNKIATIEFGHPSGNSFPSLLLERLTNEINTISLNKNVSLIVLKSKGTNAFCGGASFDELLTITNPDEGNQFFSGFAHVINAMRLCPKIIVGRVQGKAVGGGVGLIAACDYTLATIDAALKLSEVAIGIGPFVIEPAITRKIGKANFGALALAPKEWKNADWGKEKGLYNAVFENSKAMDIELEHYCENLSNYHPEALVALKKILWEGTNHWDELLLERAKVSGQLVLSEYTKNTLASYKK
jgi:methylglutaconyl-CoA hydratase